MKIALVELASVDYLNIYALVKMPRGIPLLAAILEKKGHAVDCFVQTIQRINWRDLFEYDLIGFSIISCTAKPTYQMIERLREEGFRGTIVVGGPHATASPKESLDIGADAVVRHEGDKSFPELTRAVQRQDNLDDVRGVTWKRGSIVRHSPDQLLLTEQELSLLPLPAFRTIAGYETMRQVSLTFSRGCPYACEFCAVEAMFGQEYRFSSVESRMSQLEEFRRDYPELWQNCIIFFADDNFFGSRRGREIAIEMLEQMIAKDLQPPRGWLCQMRITDASAEVTNLMKESGCRIVCLGIESADARTLKAMHKGQTPEQIRVGLENLHSAGIETLAMMIAGADTDTFWSFFAGIRKLAEWGITYLQVVAMVPLASTKMTQRFLLEGRKFSQNYDRYNGMHVLIKPKRMSKFGVLMSVYLVTFWFYFVSKNGRKLLKKQSRQYCRMFGVALKQFLKWPWQAVKERFAAS